MRDGGEWELGDVSGESYGRQVYLMCWVDLASGRHLETVSAWHR